MARSNRNIDRRPRPSKRKRGLQLIDGERASPELLRIAEKKHAGYAFQHQVNPYEVYRSAAFSEPELSSTVHDIIARHPKDRMRFFGRNVVKLFGADEYNYIAPRYGDPRQLKDDLEVGMSMLPPSGYVELSGFVVHGDEDPTKQGLRFVKACFTARYARYLKKEREKLYHAISPEISPKPIELGIVLGITPDLVLARETAAELNEVGVLGEEVHLDMPYIMAASSRRTHNRLT